MLIATSAFAQSSKKPKVNLAGRQPIEWASSVEKFSSEADDRDGGAKQVLGAPNVMPQGGASPTAWQPKKDGNEEFITVNFSQPEMTSHVVICENVGAGAVSKVELFASGGKSLGSKMLPVARVASGKRSLVVEFSKTAEPVAQVRVELQAGKVAGVQQIDAIGIASGYPNLDFIRLPVDLDVKAKPERLSASINSPYQEVGPIISTDGQTLYFNRRNHPENIGGKDDKEDIWLARYDESTKSFARARNIGKPLNNADFNFISSTTPDGNMLLLGNVYLEDGTMAAGASVAMRTAEGWSEPEEIVIKNEDNKNKQVDYFMSSSGRVLIISEERKDSYGGRDLYISFQNEKGEWSTPENMGPTLNTAANEYAPFLAADQRTLYYSTSGRPGYGGDDVYISRRIGQEWKDWAEAENLGKPLNTAKDDAFFTIPASGQYAYYVSGGQAGKEDLDVFRIVIPKSQRPKPVVLVRGRVFDSKTQKPVSAEIVYEDLKTGQQVGVARSAPGTGEFLIALPSGLNYGYLAQADNYFSTSANLDLAKLETYKEVKQDLYLTPREVGATVRLNNLFFDFNKAELRPESYPELNRIIKIIGQNKALEMQIAGHTDSVGTVEVNQQLSQDRALAVVNYLAAKGVPAERISAQGYGKTKPVATNKTEEGRQQNRRVEFLVKKI